MNVGSLSETNYEKIQNDLEFIITCFREVLEESGESELARRLPWTSEAKSDENWKRINPSIGLSVPRKPTLLPFSY